jgi:xyloglucan:xyloglucosyl transferase
MGAKASSSWCLLLVVGVLLVAAEEVFDKNYEVQWGADGYHLVIRGTEANITMDQSSGKFVAR